MQTIMIQTVSQQQIVLSELDIYAVPHRRNQRRIQAFLPSQIQNQSQRSIEDINSTITNSCSTISTSIQNEQPLLDSHQQWSQITSIVKKIHKMESQLICERRLNRELTKKVKLFEQKIALYELQIRKYCDNSSLFNQKQRIQQNRNTQLEENIAALEQTLSEKQKTIQDYAYKLVKKNTETEERIKKMNNDYKEVLDRIRKTNIELEKQRTISKNLKNQLSTNEGTQLAGKVSILLEQNEALKKALQSSKEQRQIQLCRQIDECNNRIFHLEQDIKYKDIQLCLYQRKKQQSINEYNQKKDNQLRSQKMLLKNALEKANKLEAQLLIFKKSSPHNFKRTFKYQKQEQVSFDLSQSESTNQ